MLLQMAIDLAKGPEVTALAKAAAGAVDIIEIGTPVILREGVAPVRAVKNACPEAIVLADTKIVDGGALECGYALEAGADIVTVLAMAEDATVTDVIGAAHRAGKKVMADLIGVTDIAGRAKELLTLGADYVCVHTPVDVQKTGRTPLGDLTALLTAVPPERAAVAGGVKLSTLPAYAALRPGIIIAGGALAGAADPKEAALQMRRIMKEAEI